MNPGDIKVLSYHDVLLRQRDVDSLKPGCWVLDQVFEFYLDFLSREVHVDCKDVLYIPPSTTMLLLHQGIFTSFLGFERYVPQEAIWYCACVQGRNWCPWSWSLWEEFLDSDASTLL